MILCFPQSCGFIEFHLLNCWNYDYYYWYHIITVFITNIIIMVIAVIITIPLALFYRYCYRCHWRSCYRYHTIIVIVKVIVTIMKTITVIAIVAVVVIVIVIITDRVTIANTYTNIATALLSRWILSLLLLNYNCYCHNYSIDTANNITCWLNVQVPIVSVISFD